MQYEYQINYYHIQSAHNK